jgi:hypothetical protein
MHSIRTFILRVFHDTHDPDMLRGSLQVIGENGSHTFIGDENLCLLLASLVQEDTGQTGLEKEGQADPDGLNA